MPTKKRTTSLEVVDGIVDNVAGADHVVDIKRSEHGYYLRMFDHVTKEYMEQGFYAQHPEAIDKYEGSGPSDSPKCYPTLLLARKVACDYLMAIEPGGFVCANLVRELDKVIKGPRDPDMDDLAQSVKNAMAVLTGKRKQK